MSTSPVVFYTSVAWVILGYLYLLLPLFLCAAVIFCLPCVLFAMRFLQIGQEVGTGANDEELKKIEQVQFMLEDKDQSDSLNSSSSTLDTRNSKERKEGKFYDLETNECIRTIEREDCNCVICLSDYEDKERLRVLRCSHHFHQQCVDEWLKLHKTCPLCVADPLAEQGEEDNISVHSEPAQRSELLV
jgi:hypothetical protein